MPAQEENKKMLTDLIQKQMVVLGPNIALDTARRAVGLQIGDDGQVLELSGDFPMVLKALVREFMLLSGPVARLALASLLEKNKNDDQHSSHN